MIYNDKVDFYLIILYNTIMNLFKITKESRNTTLFYALETEMTMQEFKNSGWFDDLFDILAEIDGAGQSYGGEISIEDFKIKDKFKLIQKIKTINDWHIYSINCIC